MDTAKRVNILNIRDVGSIVWKRKWLMIIPVFLVTTVTAISTFYLVPTYEASVTIFMERPVRLSQDLQRLIGGAGAAGGSGIESEQELRGLQNEIVSSPYIAQLIQNLGLDRDPFVETRARKVQVKQPNVSLDDLKFDILLKDLRKLIRVEFVGINQVRIIAQSSSAEQARDLAKNLGDIFIQEKTKQESRTITASSDFSSDQLAMYEQDLQDKIARKTQLETEQLRFQPDRTVASQENREQINTEIQAISVEIGDREKDVHDAQIRLANFSNGLPLLEESPLLKEKVTEITKMLSGMSDMIQKYSWNTPSMVAFKVRLYGLISDVDEEVAQIVRARYSQYSESTKNDLITVFSSRLRIETLYSYNNNLKLALTDIDRRVALIPGYAANIEQLIREIDAARTLRDQFKLSQEGTQISQALLLESKFRVVEPARLPLAPIWPNKRAVVMLGLLMGFCLGIGALVIAEFFDNSIKKIEDAEEALGFAVVGTMPRIEGLEKLKMTVGH